MRAAVPRGREKRVLLALGWYATAIHRGIARYAQGAHWILDGGLLRGDPVPRRWPGDGILCVLGVQPAIDRLVARSGLPAVNIGAHETGRAARVCSDNAAVGRLAAEHFLERGFHDLAFFACSQSPAERQRREAFAVRVRDAGARFHGLDFPQPAPGRTGPSRSVRHRRLGQRLARLPRPLAVFAEYDDTALEVLDAALAAGLRVPEEIAILGVDNDDLRCPFAAVPLSSIDDDQERIGFEAAAQLDALMRGERVASPVLIAPRHVVVRQSTDIMALAHPEVATALKLIWRHFREPISVQSIVADLPIGYRALHEAFVKHLGRGMAEEIQRRRLEEVRRLLIETDLKAGPIARMTGFRSADRMGKAFKRALGSTLPEFRRRARGE